MNLLIPEIFDPYLGARPATYTEDRTAAEPVEHEIFVAFRRDRAESTFGQTGTFNAVPSISAPTEDVPNIGINSKFVVHYGYLTDENGEEILDEAGEKIIAENYYTLYPSQQPMADAFGVTEMEVSLEVPN